MRRFVPLAMVVLAACAQAEGATIDGSSDQAFKDSMAAVRAELSVSDRTRFEAAVKLAQAEAFAKADSRAEYKARLRAKLAGKTGAQVIAEASTKAKDAGNAAADMVFDLKKKAAGEIQDFEDAAREAKEP